jgi:hypothetical protein
MISRRQSIIGVGGLAAVAAVGVFAFSNPDYEAAVSSLWAPRQPRGPDDLEYLVHYARLSANNHNVQPWHFKRTDTGLLIQPDMSRATPVVDPDNHHLFASLGCACENLMIAAAANSQSASAVLTLTGDIQVTLDSTANTKEPLFNAILDRQTTRSEYSGQSSHLDDLSILEKAASVEGCKVMLVTDRILMGKIVDLIVAGNTKEIENPAFAKELKSWLRFNAASAIRTGDGLYSACSGNPSVPSWIGGPMFDFMFTASRENDKIAKQVRSSAGLAVIVADKDDKAHWMLAGRSCQRFALQATLLGLKHAYLNQAVEVKETRAQLAQLLGIGDKRPNLVLRFGYGDPLPKSLRRPISDIILTEDQT